MTTSFLVSDDERGALRAALRMFLCSFERERVEEAAPESSLWTSRILYNRLDNIRLGNAENYNLERIPNFDYRRIVEGKTK